MALPTDDLAKPLTALPALLISLPRNMFSSCSLLISSSS